MAVVTVNGGRIGRAHEKISTLTSATVLTAATYNKTVTTNDPYSITHRPIAAMLQCETAAIRWTGDGTTPTVSAGTGIGFTAQPGDIITLEGYENITKFQAINDVATSGAALQVEYYYNA